MMPTCSPTSQQLVLWEPAHHLTLARCSRSAPIVTRTSVVSGRLTLHASNSGVWPVCCAGVGVVVRTKRLCNRRDQARAEVHGSTYAALQRHGDTTPFTLALLTDLPCALMLAPSSTRVLVVEGNPFIAASISGVHSCCKNSGTRQVRAIHGTGSAAGSCLHPWGRGRQGVSVHTKVLASRSAPRLTSALMVSTRPFSAARIRAVWPSCGATRMEREVPWHGPVRIGLLDSVVVAPASRAR